MRLTGKQVGVFVEEGFEDLEFWVTVMRLREEGAQVPILGSDRVGKGKARACVDRRQGSHEPRT